MNLSRTSRSNAMIRYCGDCGHKQIDYFPQSISTLACDLSGCVLKDLRAASYEMIESKMVGKLNTRMEFKVEID